jgi:hypothetical protein
MFSALSGNVTAEEKEEVEYGWKKTAVAGLNFTQNSFDNWAQGGEDSWSWQLDVNAALSKTEKKYDWSNSLKTSFGKTRVGDESARKAADELRFESVYSRLLGIFVDPYASVSARTQYAAGYDYSTENDIQTSDSFDPTYFTESVGLGIKPADFIKTRVGAAMKQTVSSVKYGYADDPDTKDEIEDFKNEFGAELVTDLSFKLDKNIMFTSKVEIFSDFNTFKSIDVNWDNMFKAKVSEYIDVSLNIRIFYDEDISPKRQISQTLAVGLTYTLF